jgi:hypothetical protein
MKLRHKRTRRIGYSFVDCIMDRILTFLKSIVVLFGLTCLFCWVLNRTITADPLLAFVSFLGGIPLILWGLGLVE